MTTKNWWEDEDEVRTLVEWMYRNNSLGADPMVDAFIREFPRYFEIDYDIMRQQDLALRRMAESDSRTE